jgi:tetratricopeptide (TPR) repeat protein
VKKNISLLLIIVTVLAVYAPALRDGFVWDDTALVLRDPLIRSWRLIPEGFNHFLFVDATASDFYRPIQRLLYTLEYAAFAFQPAGYHLTNILWHAMAAIALFLFAEELLLAFGVEPRKRRLIALIATMVWAIHPVHTAAVVYVSGLADPLAATFGFFGCFFVLRAARANGAAALAWLIGAAISFLLSSLSKESGFVFLAVSIGLLALRRKWNVLWKVAVVALFVCAIYFNLRRGAEHNPAPVARTPAPLSVRPMAVARAFAEYAGLIVFPLNLHMDRQVNADMSIPGDARVNVAAWRELQTLLGIVLIALMIFWAIRSRRRNRLVFTLLVLAGISYLPVSGIWLLNAAVAEHWVYVPSAFLFLAATAAIVDLAETRVRSRAALFTMSILTAMWCVFLAARTFVRTFDWQDQRAFLERTIANGGDSARMLINLGTLELSQDHVDLAKKDLQAALRREPDQPLAILNLAAVALKENDFKRARELLLRATEMPVVDARAHELLAVLENKEHHRADLMRLRLAARTGSPDWSIEKRYIKVLDETGSTSKAIDELRHCLAIEWYRAESWALLSELLNKAGHPQESAQALAQANAYDVHLSAEPSDSLPSK